VSLYQSLPLEKELGKKKQKRKLQKKRVTKKQATKAKEVEAPIDKVSAYIQQNILNTDLTG